MPQATVAAQAAALYNRIQAQVQLQAKNPKAPAQTTDDTNAANRAGLAAPDSVNNSTYSAAGAASRV
jgi:hypothetical protein